MTEDEMVGWHHRLNGHEFEQIPGDGEGPGSLAWCSPWGCKESDMTEQLSNKNSLSHEFVTYPCVPLKNNINIYLYTNMYIVLFLKNFIYKWHILLCILSFLT